MAVSVIIPSFNRKKLLGYTLKSILECKEIDLEILVIDDGSTDGTEELIKKEFSEVRYFKQNKKGAPSARNLGLNMATKEFVVFIDSDDLVEKGFFESKIKFLRSQDEFDAVYGPWEFFEGEGLFQEKEIIPRHSVYPLYEEFCEAVILKNLLAGWFIVLSAILWRKSFLLKMGGFREDLIVNQDVDLLFRAIQSGLKVRGCEGGRTLIREHQSERVGKVKGNSDKINQILTLRKLFKRELESSGNWNKLYATALAEYTFELWSLYRKSHPKEAKAFLEFSQTLDPNIQLKGGIILKFLSKIFGSHRAIIIKQAIKF
jgi:glycosyltransferase involved in cell wall biosynthesis